MKLDLTDDWCLAAADREAGATRHALLLKGFEGHQDAAKAITDLRYDALRDLLHALAEQLVKDAEADLGRGRPKLADSLNTASNQIAASARQIDAAWAICSPFMED